MKYVVAKVQIGSLTHEMPFAFPSTVVHSVFADGLRDLCNLHGWTFVEIVGAGDAVIVADCSGSSETLGVKSRNKWDRQLFFVSDYGGGIS